jgi:hypothetical protein
MDIRIIWTLLVVDDRVRVEKWNGNGMKVNDWFIDGWGASWIYTQWKGMEAPLRGGPLEKEQFLSNYISNDRKRCNQRKVNWACGRSERPRRPCTPLACFPFFSFSFFSFFLQYLFLYISCALFFLYIICVHNSSK